MGVGVKRPLKKAVFLLLGIVLTLAAICALLAAIWRSRPQPEPTEPTLPAPAANPFSEGDFVMENGRMRCLAMDAVTGIDVSNWQGQVDWQQVKDAGIDFVMIRFARRGSTEGGLYEDESARRNYEGAKQAGLKVGGYFFSQAISPGEAEEEARFVLAMIDGWQLDMPLVYDWEFTSSPARTDHIDRRTVTDCALAFCRTVEKAGRQPMIYFNANPAVANLYLAELTDYPFWLAQYADTMDYPYRVDMWQYTDSGKIPGIDAEVDLNLYFPYD